MVRLTRIYTRAGDKGMTALGTASGCRKHTGASLPTHGGRAEQRARARTHAARLETGRPRTATPPAERPLRRRRDLCVPRRRGERTAAHLRIVPEQVQELERAIDARNRRLEPLRSFVLPGHSGRGGSARGTHGVPACRDRGGASARSGAKRRRPQVLPYLNRLSDLLFVLARCANGMGRADVLWQPGAGRPPQPAAARRSPRDVGQGAPEVASLTLRPTRCRSQRGEKAPATIRAKARRGASSSPSLASAHSA